MKKKRKWLVILGTIASLATIVSVVWSMAPTGPSPPRYPQYMGFPIHLSADTDFGFPIYLRDNQRLHFTWWVRQGGEVTVGFVTPRGEFFGFYEDSDNLEKDRRAPLKGGSTQFKPRDHGWKTGYYEVRMTAHSQTTEIEVRYWID